MKIKILFSVYVILFNCLSNYSCLHSTSFFCIVKFVLYQIFSTKSQAGKVKLDFFPLIQGYCKPGLLRLSQIFCQIFVSSFETKFEIKCYFSFYYFIKAVSTFTCQIQFYGNIVISLKFLRTPFYIEHLRWLPLKLLSTMFQKHMMVMFDYVETLHKCFLINAGLF